MFSSERLYLIGFPLGTVEVLWGVNTDFSVIPSLVEERELADANAVFLAADRGARIVGPTLGGVAIAAVCGVNARSRRSRRYGNTRCASLLPML